MVAGRHPLEVAAELVDESASVDESAFEDESAFVA